MKKLLDIIKDIIVSFAMFCLGIILSAIIGIAMIFLGALLVISAPFVSLAVMNDIFLHDSDTDIIIGAETTE